MGPGFRSRCSTSAPPPLCQPAGVPTYQGNSPRGLSLPGLRRPGQAPSAASPGPCCAQGAAAGVGRVVGAEQGGGALSQLDQSQVPRGLPSLAPRPALHTCPASGSHTVGLASLTPPRAGTLRPWAPARPRTAQRGCTQATSLSLAAGMGQQGLTRGSKVRLSAWASGCGCRDWGALPVTRH